MKESNRASSLISKKQVIEKNSTAWQGKSPSGRTKKSPPAALAPAELVPEEVEPPPGWVNSLQPSNTQSGKFRTSYDQAPRLDSGRCNAPAPPSSCGWLHQHNSGTTQSGKFRTSYDQVTHLDSGRCNAPAPNLSCGWLNKIIRPIRPIKLIKNRPIRFSAASCLPLIPNGGKFDFATAKRIFRRVQVHRTCRGPAATLGLSGRTKKPA